VMARGLLVAETMIKDGALDKLLEERYAGWSGELGRKILTGRVGLAELSDLAEEKKLDPKPRSGRQEKLENLVNRHL